MKSGKSDIQTNGHPKAEKAIEALRCNNGRLELRNMRKWGLRIGDIDSLLETANCPFKLEFERNGHVVRCTCWVVLKDYAPPKTVTQKEIAGQLNAMTEAEYRNLLCGIDPSYRSRLARRGGYRKRGVSADTYLYGNGQ